MDKHINFLFFAALYLLATTPVEAKTYRKDYMYDWRTDAFYKLHLNADSKLRKEEVCELEGAKLMSPMSEQELLQVHAKLNQHQFPYTEEDDDLQQRDSVDPWPTIDLNPTAKDVLEMTCQVTTRDGYVKTSSVYRERPFICKVQAKDVTYNSQCRVYAKGYRYSPTIGSCYKFSRVAYTWYQAAAECQAEGGHLAVINSEQEALELKKISPQGLDVPKIDWPFYYNIGFRAVKITEPRLFKTIFNETLEEAGFNVWANNEPNNIGKYEHCGSFFTLEGKLNDNSCDKFRFAFICEKEVIYHGK